MNQPVATGIAIQDYESGDVNDLQDPTDPYEQVDREFMNQLAQLITKFEEVLDVGNGDMVLSDIGKFIAMRGDALDLIEDPVMSAWLDNMRQTARCPFRRFAVSG